MARGVRRFRAQVRHVREHSISDLEHVFAKWLDMPQTFGNPARKRLFSPLTHVLVVSVPSALAQWLLSRGGEKVPRVAGLTR